MKGANVTIQGKGFLGKDKIALTPRPSGTAVEIAPAEITASSWCSSSRAIWPPAKKVGR